jgi:PTH2 family peptidyl-tRNA hydrolase
MTDIKQVIVLNSDLDISTGKMISQACHASLNSCKKADSQSRADWEQGGSKKVVLETDEEDLRRTFQQAKDKDIPAYLVKDAGLTEVEPGTLTAVGIGPAESSKIDTITGDLGLVK